MFWWPDPLIDLLHPAPAMSAAADMPDWLYWSLLAGVAVGWLPAYALAIHRAAVDKWVGIPVTLVGINLAWEFTHSLVIEQLPEQRPINFGAVVLDIFILRQALQYGHKDLPRLSKRTVQLLVLGILAYSSVFLVVLTYELSDFYGIYAGMGINLYLSIAFILMLRQRQSSAGQSLYVAIGKCLGSLMAGLLFLFLMPDRYLLQLLAATTLLVDVAYIVLVHRQIRAEGQSPWALNRPPVLEPPVLEPPVREHALAPVG